MREALLRLHRQRAALVPRHLEPQRRGHLQRRAVEMPQLGIQQLNRGLNEKIEVMDQPLAQLEGLFRRLVHQGKGHIFGYAVTTLDQVVIKSPVLPDHNIGTILLSQRPNKAAFSG